MIIDIGIALYDMHSHNMVHCDLKPDNIVRTMEGRYNLIDYGSVRITDSPKADVLCTYLFCPPEALIEDAQPTKVIDPYALGATIYNCIFHNTTNMGYLFNAYDPNNRTREAILNLHLTGQVHIPQPQDCPHHISQEVWDIMCKLLHPNPNKRMTIVDLYFDFISKYTNDGAVEIPDSPPLRFDTFGADWPKRNDVIERLFNICRDNNTMEAFALAVNILDRYMATLCDENDMTDLMKASYLLANIVITPNDYTIPSKTVCAAMVRMMTALKFRIYSETAETILTREHRIYNIDYAKLMGAIKSAKGNSVTGARLYRKRSATDDRRA